MKVRTSLHNILLVLHRVTGLTIAAFLIMVGLTGTILAFGSTIDRWLNPELHAHVQRGRPALSLAVFAEEAEHAYPHLRSAYYSVEDDQVVMMMSARTDPKTGRLYPLDVSQLILDPWTGRILGTGVMENDWHAKAPWRMRFIPFIYSLHTSLATNTNWGWMFVGVVALIWTLDSFVGFYLTLPASHGHFWQRWRQAWTIKLGASGSRVNFDVHRAGGLWLWPLLFVFGWSSVMLGLRQVYEPVTHALFNYQGFDDSIGAQALPQPLENPKLDWAAAEAAGQKAMAEQALLHHFKVERPYGMAYIGLYGAYTYAVRSSIDWRGHGWDTTVLLDGNTGRLRELDLPRGQFAGNTVSTFLWGIHYGDLRDSLLFRIVIGFFGVFLAVLSITGVLIWWKKRRGIRSGRAMADQIKDAASSLSGADAW